MRHRGDGQGQSAARAAALPFGFARANGAFSFRDWRRWLCRWADQEVEQRRLFPWIAVAFGLGILLFFAAEGRPSLWAPAAAGLAATAAAVFARRRLLGFAIAIGFAALFFGFAAGVLRMRAVEAPVLGRTTVAPLAGFIESIEEREAGGRLVLRVHDFAAVPAEQRPRRVRVTVRDRQGLKAGDFITANARLLPPPEAARPGGYDFARDAYFRGIGAVGSVSGGVEIKRRRLLRTSPSVSPPPSTRPATASPAASPTRSAGRRVRSRRRSSRASAGSSTRRPTRPCVPPASTTSSRSR